VFIAFSVFVNMLYKRIPRPLLRQFFTSVRIICSLVENTIKEIITQQISNDPTLRLLHNNWIDLYYSHLSIPGFTINRILIQEITLRCLLRPMVAK